MPRSHRTIAAILAAGTPSFLLSPPALAQQQVIVVQTAPPANLRLERVAYGDLNLATRGGEEALKLRVSHAVEHVCLYDPHRWYGARLHPVHRKVLEPSPAADDRRNLPGPSVRRLLSLLAARQPAEVVPAANRRGAV